jgi:hypothetical protein
MIRWRVSTTSKVVSNLKGEENTGTGGEELAETPKCPIHSGGLQWN